MNGHSNIFRCIWAIVLFLSLSTVAQQAPQTASIGSAKHDYWAVEDAEVREKLPLYKIIPAARPEELTPANGYPKPETFLTWHRSHGDNGGMRYSALKQINRQNVASLEQAWIYHSGDGSNNLQCNPIVVRGIMIAPTPGNFMVGLDASNGKE
jgi:glucose dehydrogenase